MAGTPANAVNISTAGLIKFDGTATFSSTTTTNHDLLVGGASNAITNVAPSATSGVPAVSQGASSDPAFTTAVVAGGGTGDTSFTAYSAVCGGTTSTGALQNVSGVGTSNQILMSNGASALPTWVTGNILVLLSSQTASNSASISFTSKISNTYNTYLLVFSNVVPITNGTSIQITYSTNNGTSYITNNYLSGRNRNAYNTATVTNVGAVNFIQGTFNLSSTASNGPGNGVVYFFNLQNSAVPTTIGFMAGYSTSDSTLEYGQCVSQNTANTNVNALQLVMTSGNISTGTFTLYGILE